MAETRIDWRIDRSAARVIRRVHRTPANMRRQRVSLSPTWVDRRARLRPEAGRLDRAAADVRRQRVSLSPARVNRRSWLAEAGISGRKDRSAADVRRRRRMPEAWIHRTARVSQWMNHR